MKAGRRDGDAPDEIVCAPIRAIDRLPNRGRGS
jgi:hypothetical protein